MRLSAQHPPPGALEWDGAARRHAPFTWAPDAHFPERFTTGHRVGDMPAHIQKETRSLVLCREIPHWPNRPVRLTFHGQLRSVPELGAQRLTRRPGTHCAGSYIVTGGRLRAAK